jgi:ATP-dependent Clp protease protease subunit
MASLISDRLSAMFEYGIDLEKRRVFLQCGIEEHTNPGMNVAEMVTRGLLFLDKTGGDIELWINTPGGNVDDMFAIYDVIRTCENDVQTVGHGCVASAGALVLAGGIKGKRYATPNTIFMVHEFQGGVWGEGGTKQQEIQLGQKQRSEERWAYLMGRASGRKKTSKFWYETIRSSPEFWLDARGMVKHGVIDEIWPPEEEDDDESGNG